MIHKDYKFLLLCSLGVLVLGMLSGYIAHVYEQTWYMQLSKPEFTPPSWVFRPVWMILYLMLGYVLGLLWKQRTKDAISLSIYCVQLLLNFAWSPIFFGLHNIAIAFFILVIMVMLTMIIFVRASRYIQLLLVPYLAWIIFAGILNYQILVLNS